MNNLTQYIHAALWLKDGEMKDDSFEEVVQQVQDEDMSLLPYLFSINDGEVTEVVSEDIIAIVFEREHTREEYLEHVEGRDVNMTDGLNTNNVHIEYSINGVFTIELLKDVLTELKVNRNDTWYEMYCGSDVMCLDNNILYIKVDFDLGS